MADCDRPLWARGLCGTHYQRGRLGGTLKTGWGHRRQRNDGYVDIYAPEHPLSRRDGYVFEHRKVMYDAGVAVPEGHHVHHVNGDKADNRPENLEVLSASEHPRRHALEAGYVVNQFGTWPVRQSS